MPMRLTDARIRSFVAAQTPTPRGVTLTDTAVIDLLAAVGDTRSKQAGKLKTELTKPGLSRTEQLALAKAGMSQSEKADLAEVLDKSGWVMEPGAKNFLEALLDRAPLQETFGPLTLIGDQKNGIAGIAKAGDVIEAINLSTAPAGRLHLVDTQVIATADNFGKFTGNLPDVREGDLIRLRTRAADGKTSDWLTIQASGIESSDTRNAVINLERMDLSVGANGIEVRHNTARPLSEPGATIRFINARTGESVDTKVTDAGSLPAGVRLPGLATDEFTVWVTDGKNNADFAVVSGILRVPGSSAGTSGVDLPDPALVKDDLNPDGTGRYKLDRFQGPLFIDEPTAGDVRQGAIGNCYFPAAIAAVTHLNPQAIKDMVKQNEDGSYTVRFFEGGNRNRQVQIKVDGDLYVRSSGSPLYGACLGGVATKESMELWFPIIEKAYARWKGSYDTIGHGGNSATVMSEVLGRPRSWDSWIAPGQETRLFERIKADLARGSPVACGTHGKDQAAMYSNTGVYANHAYSVFGVEEKNGEKFVKLRNPWGESEYGYGIDGKNDGVFDLPLNLFTKFFSNLYTLS